MLSHWAGSSSRMQPPHQVLHFLLPDAVAGARTSGRILPRPQVRTGARSSPSGALYPSEISTLLCAPQHAWCACSVLTARRLRSAHASSSQSRVPPLPIICVYAHYKTTVLHQKDYITKLRSGFYTLSVCMDLTDLAIQPGKVYLVREVLHNGVTGSVRVLGRYVHLTVY